MRLGTTSLLCFLMRTGWRWSKIEICSTWLVMRTPLRLWTLMSYAPEDEMPSVFLLRESKRQSILAVFNWTEKERKYEFPLSELGLTGARNQVLDVFAAGFLHC